MEIIGYDPPTLCNTHTPLPTHTPSHSQNEVGTKEAEEEERERDMHSDRKRRRDGDVEQGTSSSSLASKVGKRRRATAAKISKERRKNGGLRKISIPGQNVDWISQTMNTSATSGTVCLLLFLGLCYYFCSLAINSTLACSGRLYGELLDDCAGLSSMCLESCLRDQGEGVSGREGREGVSGREGREGKE